MEALENEATCFENVILAALLEHPDREIRARLVRWCRTKIEATEAYRASYYGDLPEPERAWLSVLARADEDDRAEWLDGCEHPWIQAMFLDGPEMPYVTPDDAGHATIESFDAPAFSLGKNINGLAVSPDGALLCAVGENTARLLDAHTGALLR